MATYPTCHGRVFDSFARHFEGTPLLGIHGLPTSEIALGWHAQTPARSLDADALSSKSIAHSAGTWKLIASKSADSTAHSQLAVACGRTFSGYPVFFPVKPRLQSCWRMPVPGLSPVGSVSAVYFVPCLTDEGSYAGANGLIAP